MKQVDPERLQAALNDHECEIMLLRQLVHALLDAHPNRQKVVERFRNESGGLVQTAPPGTDPEFLVELRARLQLHLAELNAPYKPVE